MTRTLVCASIVALLATSAPADVPPGIMSFQGVLRGTDDRPVTGSYSMTFRYWSDATSVLPADDIGSETHPAVTVTGGLFDVLLGSQPFQPGTSGYAGGGIVAMFGDFDEIWVEIGVGAETLLPRIRVAAAPYAFSCSQVQLNGTLQMDEDGPDADQVISFWEAGSPIGESMKWADGQTRFEISDDLLISGTLHTGVPSDAPVTYNRIASFSGAPSSGQVAGRGDLYVEYDLEVDSQLFLNGELRMDDDGPDHNQTIYFYDDALPTNESLAWAETEDRFEITNDLAIGGVLQAGATTATPRSYSAIGTGTPGSQNINASDDLFVAGSLEVGAHLLANSLIYMDWDGPDSSQNIFFYEGASGGRAIRWDDPEDRFEMNDSLKLTGAIELNNTIEMDDNGPDQNQRIYFWEDGIVNGESFGWTDVNDRFELTDSLHVSGDLSATGAKPFVQNHPYRNDLSVVYAALEGDEVGTYTRGSARLSGGVARVALGDTFALVTSPDLGLTAHLTPRRGGASLWVESVTTSELVVRAEPGSASDAEFDYIVFGLRIGFEEHAVVQPRLVDAPIPSRAAVEARFRDRPELRAHTALARFAGVDPPDRAASEALRATIGEYDPEAPRPPSPAEPASPGPDRTGSEPASREPDHDAAGRAPVPERDIEARSFRPRLPDLAAVLPVEGAVEPGDVVVNDPEAPGRARRAEDAADRGVLGVVTDTAGVALGSSGGGAEAAVAMSGVVTCKVDAGYGTIAPNDLLTTSATPGHAMRASDPEPGTVLGKALEGLAAGTGKIRVLVTLR